MLTDTDFTDCISITLYALPISGRINVDTGIYQFLAFYYHQEVFLKVLNCEIFGNYYELYYVWLY